MVTSSGIVNLILRGFIAKNLHICPGHIELTKLKQENEMKKPERKNEKEKMRRQERKHGKCGNEGRRGKKGGTAAHRRSARRRSRLWKDLSFLSIFTTPRYGVGVVVGWERWEGGTPSVEHIKMDQSLRGEKYY